MYLNEESADSFSNKPIIIVLSHLRWDFVFQRPQQLLTRAARDFSIFFIEEPIYEGDVATQRSFMRESGVCVIQPILPHNTTETAAIAHQRDVAEAVAAQAGAEPIILWYYTPMALAFGQHIAADVIVFDKMDELSAFAFAPPELRFREASLMGSADLVFTGGAALHATAVGRNPDVYCFPSSIDAAHFEGARSAAEIEPHDQFDIPYPRVGFFGVIDERIDLDLIAQVAALRPNWQFVMVGPTAKIDPATLPGAANIHWLGPKDYSDLPAYMAHWNLGWMPFALNASTRFISPTKTPEFLAAGLPLLSTPIADVVEPYGRLGLVEIAETAAAMVVIGDRLLMESEQPANVAKRLAAVDRQLAGSSWDETWAAMHALIVDTMVAPAAQEARLV